MKSRRSTVFIVELMILFIILLVVIVTITTLSMKTREQSESAGRLTGAVVCAENFAEITSGADTVKQAAAMIGKMDNTDKPVVKGNIISAKTQPGTDDSTGEQFVVRVTVDEEKGKTGRFIKKKIEVYDAKGGEGKMIYDLETGEYFRGDVK